MAGQPEISNLALFCDFENIALGVRDAKFATFDIRKVLERLLLKGSIVVKKAYCDWDRYKEFKRPMHEANFELIEIPHVRQSGKNSADIRMVVDALDLCYTKSHVDAFVIISGDSDFSPLVSKLRENNKHVIGIGVRDSTSDLLAANCDEFIFYDDLVRETAAKRTRARKTVPKVAAAEKREEPKAAPKSDDAPKPAAAKREPTRSAADKRVASKSAPEKRDELEAVAEQADEPKPAIAKREGSRSRRGSRRDKSEMPEPAEPREESDESDVDDTDRRQEALDLLIETIEALVVERGDDEKMWGSMVKQTMKRRRPGFNESSFGYKSFRELVDDAASRNLLIVVSDERPGQYALRLPPG